MAQPLNALVISAQTNTGTVVSSAVESNFTVYATLQGVFSSGTAAGTLKLQGSNDPPGTTPVNWSDIAGATVTVASGATSVTPVANICHAYIRAAWVASGGTGTLSVRLKALGAQG